MNKNEVFRYLGYRGQEIDDFTNSETDAMIELCENIVKTKFIYKIFDVSVKDKIYLKNSELILDGTDIYNHLKEAKKCAVLACTLGAEAERELLKLSKTNLLRSVIFDAVCTARIEETADECEEKIKEYAKENGYFTNFRYSPGYGDFPLDMQKSLISALEAEKRIGLTVTDNFLMIPRKSVTAVIGLFNIEQQKNEEKCEVCSMRHTCKYKTGAEKCGK